MKTKLTIFTTLIITTILLSACSALPLAQLGEKVTSQLPAGQSATSAQAPAAPAAQALSQPADSAALAAFQGTLENIYNLVNPAVVNIEVTTPVDVSQLGPFNQQNPFNNNPSTQPPVTGASGSGFVWDKDGHIVTNNHVVDGATDITVIFADGRRETATIVGQDKDADLAVIKVDNIGSATPLTLADSSQVKVGELAIAIGNAFGLGNAMSQGIVSALDRSLPVDTTAANGQTYTIPDIIQTDAAINPGNSGGVLVNDRGEVIGVTSALESPVRANSGVGFVIPSNIVSRIVPELISKGSFAHPWLGISGTTLTSKLATAMKLDANQTGVLVVEVLANSPAEKAGLKGGQNQVQIDGVPVQVGGDVIVSIDGQPVKTFDDLASYLVNHGEIGKAIQLEVLRDNKSTTLDVILAARPAQSQATSQQGSTGTGKAYLGIQGFTVNSAVAKALGIDEQQTGVLVGQVQSGSPADTAGLHGGDRTLTVNGQQITAGGDIITAINGNLVHSMPELKGYLSDMHPGDTAQLSVLRDGKTLELEVTLGEAPAN